MFQDLFKEPQTQYYQSELIVINIVAAFIFGLIIAYLYVRTHKGSSYSQSFVQTLVLMCATTSIVMMIIGNSLARAFGLVGAFSIIRFRTVVKDSRDIAFLFLALGMGMALGTNSHLIAFIGMIAMSAIIQIVHMTNVGRKVTEHHLLNMRFRPNAYDEHEIERIFKTYLKAHLTLNISSIKANELSEVVYEIKLKDPAKSREFVNEVRAAPGIDGARLVASSEHWE
ncbi:MAG: DUF4956 domain-containing protein [Candidatus Omnitrophica bacterium]|nr:DUF4956 domain-containing protein [Candidatus Omnitrophota bacterium]